MSAKPSNDPDLLESLLAAQAAWESATSLSQRRAALWQWHAAVTRIKESVLEEGSLVNL